jgi:hypothetical protein
MPGIVKIGMTERTPETRLSEANASDTWRPPTPYKIEFAKKVANASEKEKILHLLLEQYTDRIHPQREFFRVSSEEVRKFFDLIDGEMWVETRIDEEEEMPQANPTSVKGSRDMANYFTNGQRIRHTVRITKSSVGIMNLWIGIYDSSKNGIICNGKLYTSLSKFALLHNRLYNPTRMSTDGWTECECEVDGKWVACSSLRG